MFLTFCMKSQYHKGLKLSEVAVFYGEKYALNFFGRNYLDYSLVKIVFPHYRFVELFIKMNPHID